MNEPQNQEHPNFVAIVAVSIDGKIGRDASHLSDWTSPEDKQFMRDMLKKCDAVVVGRKTFETAQAPLMKRNTIVFSGSAKGVEERHPHVWFINPSETDVVEFCQKQNFKQMALLGGARTYGYFVDHGLVDDWYITIEPFLFGAGVPLLEGIEFDLRRMKLLEVKQLNDAGAVLLHYQK